MLTAVFGRRGSGKTTMIRAMIPELKKPIVVIDVLGNFEGYEHDGQEWTDVDTIQDALNEIKNYCENSKEHSGVIVVQSGNLDNAIDFICSALWKIEGGTLVIDEVDAFSFTDAPCYDEAIRYGRNRGIDVVTGCRRPAEISKQITAAADRVYCFVTREPRDIEYYREFLGDEIAFQIPKLPPYHGIYYDFLEQKHGVFKTDENGKITILKTFSEAKSLNLNQDLNPKEELTNEPIVNNDCESAE
jgi:hypothetical protein